MGSCKRDIRAEDARNCVYFISDGNYIKIGVATDLLRRLASLQTGNPNKLEVKCIIEFESKREASYQESRIHRYFKSKHHFGEWFDLSDEDILLVQQEFNYDLSRVVGI